MKTKPFGSVLPPEQPPICGIVVSSSWHEPVACAYPPSHEGQHSWASIPALPPGGLEAWWSLPREGDKCPENDGGTIVTRDRQDTAERAWGWVELGDELRAAEQLLDLLRTMESRDLLALNREGQRGAIVVLDALAARCRQLEEALETALDCKGSFNGQVSRLGGYPAVCTACEEKIRAVLAEGVRTDSTLCHICGKRRNEPGELFCSAAHPLAEGVRTDG